jgi:hypothetical protein
MKMDAIKHRKRQAYLVETKLGGRKKIYPIVVKGKQTENRYWMERMVW